jgi:hypothetical protein
MFRKCHVAMFVGALLAASVLSAQTDASLSGTVADPSGAHIAGASVTALNIDTGVSSPSTTNGDGIYSFPSLPTGTYRLSAEHAGFSKKIIDQVILAVGSQLTVNIDLALGQVSDTVEVAATVTDINASSATIGDVMETKRLVDLPLVGRSSYDLINTQPGVIFFQGQAAVNINGQAGGAVNYTTDGINTQDNLLNGATTAAAANNASIDRVEEFRIVTSPADAEYGRGSGQVQMTTRAGTNKFTGSAWDELRNTDLDANDWFNNQKGVNLITGAQAAPRNILQENQYGFRLGGPVILPKYNGRNKTFFNGIWEQSNDNQKNTVNPEVYTASALAGQYRYIPGLTNANAAAVVPSVTTGGVPVAPATSENLYATGNAGRTAESPLIAKYLSPMPLPNNYLVGDGLNTAGYTWAAPTLSSSQLFEGRVDHIFNEKHRITITLNHQSAALTNPGAFPGSPVQFDGNETTQYSFHVTSVLKPNLLNEFRFGVFRPRVNAFAPFDPLVGKTGTTGLGLLPQVNGTPFTVTLATTGISSPVNPASSSSNRITQNYDYGDDVTWIKGKHSFKGGVTVRFIGNEGYDEVGVVPNANIANSTNQGAVLTTGLTTLPGIGTNANGAVNLLNDLTGTLYNATANLNSPGGKNPQYIPGETRYSDLLEKQISGYFKDDWKVTPSLTLNLGVRYEWYGVPYDGLGRGQALVGGSNGIFGISGTNLGAEFQPGVMNGSLTQLQLVGPGTSQPNTQFYPNDNHNFGPAVGLAWSLPAGRMSWLTGGKDKTVIRAGYGISYVQTNIYLAHMSNSYQPNGLSTISTEQSAGLLNVSNVPMPITTTAVPFATLPLNNIRSSAAYSFANNLTNPYVQNYNFSIQRSVSQTTSFTVAFVGTAGDKLQRAYDVNEVNILENGFLTAFNTVAKGGDSPMMDAFFKPLGLGSGVLQRAVLGTYFANNEPAFLAGLINGSSLSAGVGGALVAAAGLPANNFVVNPQFAPFPLGSSADAFGGAYITDNSGHSTYNSLQISANHRLSHGLTVQGSYVWSKAIGDSDTGDSVVYFQDYRTLRNEGLDKQVLSYNHAGVFKVNSVYNLPIGPGGMILKGNSFIDRVLGGWQLAGIFTAYTGAPLTITGANGLNLSYANGLSMSTATQVGKLPAGAIAELSNGVTYLNGLTIVTDPQVAGLSSTLQPTSTLKAIASSSGTPLLVNALPGALGALGFGTLTGPGAYRLDMNLVKRFKISERFNAQVGIVGQNVLNHEVFSAPSLNINSTSFGRITSSAGGFGPRIFALQARLNF